MIVFKEFTFEAAHYLVNVPRDHKCARMHGHSYKVRVECEGELVDALGWVVDYAEIATVWDPLFDRLDHSELNDIPGLEVSTSEHVARWIFCNMKPALPSMVAVEVRETATAGARYSERACSCSCS